MLKARPYRTADTRRDRKTTMTAHLAATRNTDATRKARYTRRGLTVAALMIALMGVAMIILGLAWHQPGLIVVASSACAAGGASIAAAYATHRKAAR